MAEDIIKRKLKSGVTCYVVPKKGYVEKQGMIAVNYGSSDDNIVINGEEREYPLGIAHFLEHKLFEEENGNVFDEFAKLGANANAFTNFNTTAYYFNCIDNFEKCMDILLGFVGSTYLTEENVEKEKGIITQEIKMYEDDPMWQVYFSLLEAMYKEHPMRNNIAGTVESVNSITKEMLEECYDTFYTMENAVVVVAGDVEPEAVFKQVESRIKLGKGKDVERRYGNEPNDVVQKRFEKKMQVDRPIFNIGFKENQFDLDVAERMCTSRVLLDIILGSGSRLYERLYNKGLIDDSFGYEYLSGNTYGASIISGVSDEPETVKKEITDEIARYKRDGIPSDDIERIKKKHLGRLKRSMDSISGICANIADNYCKGIEMLDIYNKYDNINSDILMKRLKHLDGDLMAISIISPI